jgi:hypothetical protein
MAVVESGRRKLLCIAKRVNQIVLPLSDGLVERVVLELL